MSIKIRKKKKLYALPGTSFKCVSISYFSYANMAVDNRLDRMEIDKTVTAGDVV